MCQGMKLQKFQLYCLNSELEIQLQGVGGVQQPLFAKPHALKTAGLDCTALCAFPVGVSLGEDLSFVLLF